jgi:hypothetical protein
MEDLSKINVCLMESQDEMLPLVSQTEVMLFYIIAYHWKSTIS